MTTNAGRHGRGARDSLSVAFFLVSLQGGGAERVIMALCEHLRFLGFDVTLVVGSSEGEYEKQLPEGLRVFNLSVKRFRRSFRPLVRFLIDQNPDVLVSGQSGANLFAALAATFSSWRGRLILRESNTLTKQFSVAHYWWGPIFLFLAKALYLKADKIIAVSAGVRADLQSLSSRFSALVEVIPNPVDLGKIERMAQEPVTECFWPKEGTRVIVAMGRLTYQKDHVTLIRALSLIPEDERPQLRLFGNGPLRADLSRLVSDLRLEAWVKIQPFTDNPYKYMRRADLLVLSSRWEGMPNILIEALACGCPIVSTDCESGPREILSDGRFGRLVPVGDATTLAREIVSEFESPMDAMILKKRAAEFSLDVISAKYGDVIQDGLNK